jgi:hypothetical protein
MMLGEAVGKGLNIKGKSAVRGKLSGFVPFLQIKDNRHKTIIRTLNKYAQISVFYRSIVARNQVADYLESVAQEMLNAVGDAKKVLEDENAHPDEQERANETLLWDIPDYSITVLDDYSPDCYGIEVPSRLLWEAMIVRQDCYCKPGSQYDGGRPSIPAFQDMNNAALQCRSQIYSKAVLWQNADNNDPLNVFELLMAYEELGRVRPVVSDFDPFVVGTRRVKYDVKEGCLPSDQIETLKWCIDQIGTILDSPTRPESWTNRWLEVLRDASSDGFHPTIPPFGFGDPKSYLIICNAVQRLVADGSVRHGAESFNYYFPQDLDDEFLVIYDGLEPVPWKYMGEEELREFLSNRIGDGFTFPLNPKWILCDPGWKKLYDMLLQRAADGREDVASSTNIWYPPESGIRERIEEISAKHPDGFVRGMRQQ